MTRWVDKSGASAVVWTALMTAARMVPSMAVTMASTVAAKREGRSVEMSVGRMGNAMDRSKGFR